GERNFVIHQKGTSSNYLHIAPSKEKGSNTADWTKGILIHSTGLLEARNDLKVIGSVDLDGDIRSWGEIKTNINFANGSNSDSFGLRFQSENDVQIDSFENDLRIFSSQQDGGRGSLLRINPVTGEARFWGSIGVNVESTTEALDISGNIKASGFGDFGGEVRTYKLVIDR
ncbi:hypothetical protein, partial [Xanthovirga aplysinae]|uniref:hypothetical protein n=1 Tax=Xanthovirga aplysinae TaxID=2529853 RepID=UPI001656FDE6